jgi:hypothetical protein
MKTNFAFRVDIWDATGDSIIEHVAAEATWLAAVKRWPKATIILRQGARVVHDTSAANSEIGAGAACPGGLLLAM